jgi:type IV pilus assembly protein PilC
MYLSMIRAGERAGTLDDIVEQLAVYLEKVDAIKTKVRSAMSYPVFTLVFAFVAVIFLLVKIVPTFSQIYGDLGQELPTLTLWVLGASNAIRNNALVSLIVALLIILGLLIWGRTPGGRYLRDSFYLRMPIFGPIVRKSVMSRFARTFGILLKSGLPILDGLQLVGAAAGNVVIARAVEAVKAKVAAGGTITRSFRETGKFPEMVLQLMSTGEESGELDEMLIKASDFYDRQVEASVHGIASLVEPVMIVLVGGLIGLIVVSMFLPIFHLGEAVMRGGYNM